MSATLERELSTLNPHSPAAIVFLLKDLRNLLFLVHTIVDTLDQHDFFAKTIQISSLRQNLKAYCWFCRFQQTASGGPWKPVERKPHISHITCCIRAARNCSNLLPENFHFCSNACLCFQQSTFSKICSSPDGSNVC